MFKEREAPYGGVSYRTHFRSYAAKLNPHDCLIRHGSEDEAT